LPGESSSFSDHFQMVIALCSLIRFVAGLQRSNAVESLRRCHRHVPRLFGNWAHRHTRDLLGIFSIGTAPSLQLEPKLESEARKEVPIFVTVAPNLTEPERLVGVTRDVVDVGAGAVIVHRGPNPTEGRYQSVQRVGVGGILDMPTVQGVRIAVLAVFRSPAA
jgi:hypothetical protein